MRETVDVGCGHKKACRSCSASSGGCLLSTQYQDGTSVYASARRLNISLGSVSSVSVAGLVFRSTQGFRYDAGTQIDGLIGLGLSSPSTSFPTVLDDWIHSNGLHDAFAIQLGPNGGAISLGGYNPSYFTGEILWTPLLHHNGWYQIPLPQISVGNTNIQYSTQIQKAKAAIDSGTTYVLVPTDVFAQIASSIASYASQSSSSCPHSICGPMASTIFYTGLCSSDIDLQTLPTIRFTFQRKMTISETKHHHVGYFTLSLTPRQYTYAKYTQNGRDCTAYGIGIGPNDVFVLGDTFMTSYYSIFDRQNMRLGLAASTQASNVVPTNEPITLVRDPNFANAQGFHLLIRPITIALSILIVLIV